MPVTMTELFLAGVIEHHGVEDNGEALVKINWDVLREYNYDLYVHMKAAEIDADLDDDTMDS
ncbi:hypothetical protein SEA_YABOI_149 [Streptomyces phage Yaboi]|jgi:hypothetical protein|uniref:Uncharacterized protein n=3 Tax=Streptomyces virus Yaboi TaxID=2846408 RepID=A0A385ULR3_9CAUD|nr:hypothetical protein HWB86_gp152 [Streptomyces phage Yaboi]QAY08792.1 hypothetical protein SEA_GENIE2_149 [Streptomyces phage Genie2]QAY12782.1 hypothetical protein SEA_BOOMERJR_149 [Streptomyces phage BoomerJR]UVD39976.1 hypothetical protein SEA_STANIMAL_147 [Streptomyces phage Stanimal]WNM73718.1 hypothetical protein SEA_SOLLERTIA_148 [Streptomyces phage Sollertia]AYB70967.1 hypothetical protein SEA_YABOI_149 [Streptomyces phage Yaboi]